MVGVETIWPGGSRTKSWSSTADLGARGSVLELDGRPWSFGVEDGAGGLRPPAARIWGRAAMEERRRDIGDRRRLGFVRARTGGGGWGVGAMHFLSLFFSRFDSGNWAVAFCCKFHETTCPFPQIVS
jgi:hypothetical protein